MAIEHVMLSVKEAWLKANDALTKLQEVMDELDELGDNITEDQADMLYHVGEVFDEIEGAITPLEDYIDMTKL